jgi:hypothetical protein
MASEEVPVDWLALPDHIMEPILALLPLTSRILAHKVCKSWSEMVAQLPPCKPRTDLWRLAGSEGDSALARWLIQHRIEGFTSESMNWAAAKGHLEVVRLLHEHRPGDGGCTICAMDDAACHGHLEVVRWLHEHRSEGCTEWAMNWAARFGHLEVVRWLHEHRTEGCDPVPRCHLTEAATSVGVLSPPPPTVEGPHTPSGTVLNDAPSNEHFLDEFLG